jgi:tRNA U34 5-carboxymethylaminomethyl modifying GTPase MnmE/TrmE
MNSFMQLSRNLEQSESLLAHYAEQDIISLKKELLESIDNYVLQVMLYGAYNAGKSTLINAMLGYDAAKVNDIPTTYKVDKYDWNGFHLLDTPGVNAPIKHEEATEEQVKRSGVMLFLIREGDQDSKDVYIRLFEMLKRGKKVFIVLNIQTAIQEDKIKAIKKINQILQHLAPKYAVNEQKIYQISIFPVNVQTAYRANSQPSEKLRKIFLEHSGYSDFIQSFTQWVKSQDTEQRHLKILQKQIDKLWYQPVMAKLKSNFDTRGESFELQSLRDNRLMLESEKRLLMVSSANYLAQEVNLHKSEVKNVLQSCQSQTELDNSLQQIFQAVIRKLEQWLSKQLEEINGKLANPVVQQKYLPSGDKTAQNLSQENLIISGAKQFCNQENIKQALLMGRSLKIPGLKGRWETTLGKWAGKAAIAVQVVTFLYDVWKAEETQTQINKQNRQQTVELYQAVEQICSTVQSDFTNSVHELIAMVFEPKIQEIQQQMDEKSKYAKKKQIDYNRLCQLRDELVSFV